MDNRVKILGAVKIAAVSQCKSPLPSRQGMERLSALFHHVLKDYLVLPNSFDATFDTFFTSR
jgi:hypothetical protein